MIIARIAYEELKNNDPVTLLVVEQELEALKQFTKEDKHSFVEAAIWHDDIKEVGWTSFTPMHYVETPYITDNYSGDIYNEPMNVTWAIAQQINALNNTIKPDFNTDAMFSFSWRFLIHLIGDIHQPLHAASMYSDYFDGNDKHGRKFKVIYPENKSVKQLHQFWDSCIDQFGSMFAPLNDHEWDLIGEYAKQLTYNTPRSKLADRLKIKDYKIWIEESYNLAIEYAYNGITPETKPSQEYIDRSRKLINEQVALAGYRLADMIMTIKHIKYTPIIKELFIKQTDNGKIF